MLTKGMMEVRTLKINFKQHNVGLNSWNTSIHMISFMPFFYLHVLSIANIFYLHFFLHLLGAQQMYIGLSLNSHSIHTFAFQDHEDCRPHA